MQVSLIKQVEYTLIFLIVSQMNELNLLSMQSIFNWLGWDIVFG